MSLNLGGGRRPAPCRRPPAALAAVPVLVAAGLLASCSSAPTTPSATPRTGCADVAAVLSDGPDPAADPVGYALAQVRPLRQLDLTGDPALRRAVDNLAAAYQSFYATNGAAPAKAAVSRAGAAVDRLCPGATQ